MWTGIPVWTSSRTTSPKRRWNTCSSIVASRSSGSSAAGTSRSEYRVILKVCQLRISIPGKSVTKCAPITFSSGTKWLGRPVGIHRGMLRGTLTRAK